MNGDSGLKSSDNLQRLLNELYGVELSAEEYVESTNNLLRLFDLLLEIDSDLPKKNNKQQVGK